MDDLLRIRSAQRAQLRRAGYDHICGTKPLNETFRLAYQTNTHQLVAVRRPHARASQHAAAWLNFPSLIYSYVTNCRVKLLMPRSVSNILR